MTIGLLRLHRQLLRRQQLRERRQAGAHREHRARGTSRRRRRRDRVTAQSLNKIVPSGRS